MNGPELIKLAAVGWGGSGIRDGPAPDRNHRPTQLRVILQKQTCKFVSLFISPSIFTQPHQIYIYMNERNVFSSRLLALTSNRNGIRLKVKNAHFLIRTVRT